MVCPFLAPARASIPSFRGSESSRLYIRVKSVSVALIVRALGFSRTLRSIEDFMSTGTEPAPPPDDVFPHMFQDIESLTFTCSIALQNASLVFLASNIKMDEIKPPKNLVLSRESMHAALDALLAGRHVSEVAAEVAQVVSAKKVSRPLARASSRAPKSSSHSARPSRPSGHGRSAPALKHVQEAKSGQGSTEDVEGAPLAVVKQAGDIGQTRTDLALPVEEAPGRRFESPIIEEEAPGTGLEIILVEDSVPRVPTRDAPEEVGSDLTKDEDVIEKVGDKRPASLEVPSPAPAQKRSKASKGSAPALPPMGKEKEVPVIPLLSAPDNDILNVEDITHQSPASVVAEIVKERMFGGVLEASDLRLLALTGLLASSTREQAAFRSRPRGELVDTIREMLLMVDARDHSLRESMDRRIEEARLEENLSATSDARGNLTAARAHTQSLQAELHSALEALKRADERTTEAQEHTKSLEAELSHTRRVLKESDERAAAAEIRSEEVLKQLSSLVETLRERDEAISQKDEVQRQYKALKADFEGLQVHLNKLSHEVRALERKCSALLEVVRHAEDKIQLECEKRLEEYQESDELKGKIERACEAHLQDYKDSSELKAVIVEAYELHLDEYKASGGMKTAIWQKAFRMFRTGYNRGLREARHAPDTPLAKLRAREVDSDGEDVLYGEDDFPLPRGTSRTAAGSSGEESEQQGDNMEDFGTESDDPKPEEGDPGPGLEGARSPPDVNVNKDTIGDDILRDVSPLRTVFPSNSSDK
ncbi:uncharacterized protein LOC110617856 [Manihot esculenta]|uniref:uncharacterized protein LOC110617856 n=1 Tax=Manihot esculenta TaxID=3983 RepID=UPI001CC80803|nr:uncharacterized protein LOC110617856 [Manihot esculenta]